jgi:hypothetical protein
MYFARRCVAGLLLGCAVFPVASASAAVNLTYSDRDATPTSRSVAQGATFPLAVLLASTTTSSADKAAGVDYFIHASNSNVFTIVSRNTTTDGSSFTDTIQTDSAVANTGINPTTGDLGGSVPNQAIPVTNGNFTVADYVISVNPAAATGGYTLSFDSTSTYSNPGSSGFGDTNFTTLGTFSVTVTTAPEPSVALPLIGMALVFSRRRCRMH